MKTAATEKKNPGKARRAGIRAEIAAANNVAQLRAVLLRIIDEM